MIAPAFAYVPRTGPRRTRGQVHAGIWAFGAILYELLAGRMLFAESKNASDAIAAVFTREGSYENQLEHAGR